MATHEVTFPLTDPQEILKLHAGDEVVVQGHIIGIRDRTQIRIFDQGQEPPMDLRGAFLLHTAPGVRKLEVLREKPVVIGGTFLEAVIAQDRIDEYKAWLDELGLTHVEISDGVIDLPRERKLELIADFARDFTVLSEVGSKDAEVVFAPYQWVEWIREELDAGAWKVITEGREGGTAGIYRPTGEMRTGLVDEIVHSIDPADLVFEAPSKSSQAWFIRQLGTSVNLGNIAPDEVIPLETLRLGLRGDTLREVLLGDAQPDPA